MGFQKSDMDYAQDLIRIFDPYSPKAYIVDPSAASFEVELRRHRKPVKQANNEVLDGIRFVSNLFTQGDLVICEECHNLIREMGSYVWDTRSMKLGEDKPLKQNDHALDAMRYVLFTNYGNRAGLKGKGQQYQHQEIEAKRWQKDPLAYPGFVGSNGWQQISTGYTF